MSKPRVAFFDFTGCEGCQLDVLNLEAEELLPLLNAVDVVTFREVMTGASDEYDVAFVEGSISREAEVPRLKHIRERANVLVAVGACATSGGVNGLKNGYPTSEALRLVYGQDAGNYNTARVRPLSDFVTVDYNLRGCPISTSEFLGLVKALLLGRRPDCPGYPVCVECRLVHNVCVFERRQTCLGPVTRAGCNAICISSGQHCRGCRGLVDDANLESERDILKKYGLTPGRIADSFSIFNSGVGVRP